MLPPGSSPPQTPPAQSHTMSLQQPIESAGDNVTTTRDDTHGTHILGTTSSLTNILGGVLSSPSQTDGRMSAGREAVTEQRRDTDEYDGLRPIRGAQSIQPMHCYTPVTPPPQTPTTPTAEYWSALMQHQQQYNQQMQNAGAWVQPQQTQTAWSPVSQTAQHDYSQSSTGSAVTHQQDPSIAQIQDLMTRMSLQQAAATPPTPLWSPSATSTAWQQQQAALVMHLMASGYAYQYAQMAATAAIQNPYTDVFSYARSSAATNALTGTPTQQRFGNGGAGGGGGYHQQHQGAPYVWNGELPPRNYNEPVFSCKIFVGGVPWDITEQALLNAFKPYGPCRVEWPGKEARYARSVIRVLPRGKVTGYVYMIFDQERSVRSLLQDCSQDFGSGNEWYFKLTAKRMRTKEIRQVQIIPWVVSDACYVKTTSQRCDPKKTVFVGALHGMITAEVLFRIMDDLFGNVVFAGIDTDKYKYPIGSGRVTFSNQRSYFKAIESAFVEIKTSKFTKRVQIDPFLEDAPCSVCDNASGPYFCRDMACFRYYCRPCWQEQHQVNDKMHSHKPLMRNTRRPHPGSECDEGESPTSSSGAAGHSADRDQDDDDDQRQSESPGSGSPKSKPFRYSTGGSAASTPRLHYGLFPQKRTDSMFDRRAHPFHGI